MKHIKKFNESTENLNVSKLENPHQMMVGSQYKITEPDYDGVAEEPYVVEVVKQMKHGFILRDIEHNSTFERTFQHLMTCEIVEVSVSESKINENKMDIDFTELAKDYLESGDAFTVHALGVRDFAKWLNNNLDMSDRFNSL